MTSGVDKEDPFLKNVKSLHSNSLRNLFVIYGGWKRVLFSPIFIFSFIISLIALLLACYSHYLGNNRVSYLSVMLVVDVVIAVLPSLLGVSFAGYAILLSVGEKDFVRVLVDNKVEIPNIFPSTYQRIIAVFAWSIFVQSFSLVLFIVIKIVSFVGSFVFLNFDFVVLPLYMNLLVLFFGLLSFIYSILLVPQNVLNIYQYGQMMNFNLLNSKKE
jgi:hypothetical protein